MINIKITENPIVCVTTVRTNYKLGSWDSSTWTSMFPLNKVWKFNKEVEVKDLEEFFRVGETNIRSGFGKLQSLIQFKPIFGLSLSVIPSGSKYYYDDFGSLRSNKLIVFDHKLSYENYVKTNILKVLKNDLEVWKVISNFKYSNPDIWTSLYLRKQFKRGEVLETEEKLDRFYIDPVTYSMIGFHSYISKEPAEKLASFLDGRVVKAIIPKGSKVVYELNHCCVSNKIIVN